MRPDWERDGIQLYCADCMDVLPHLSGVDAVVTNPPYPKEFLPVLRDAWSALFLTQSQLAFFLPYFARITSPKSLSLGYC